VHDDVMDGASTRRGQPSVHQRFVDEHTARRRAPPRRKRRSSSAISPSCTPTAGAGTCGAIRPTTSASNVRRPFLPPAPKHARPRRRAHRDLQVGATAGGCYPAHLRPPRRSRVRSPLGIPLGVRSRCDDLLGVFGDPAVTGKRGLTARASSRRSAAARRPPDQPTARRCGRATRSARPRPARGAGRGRGGARGRRLVVRRSGVAAAPITVDAQQALKAGHVRCLEGLNTALSAWRSTARGGERSETSPGRRRMGYL
jgi:hypothetical protein